MHGSVDDVILIELFNRLNGEGQRLLMAALYDGPGPTCRVFSCYSMHRWRKGGSIESGSAQLHTGEFGGGGRNRTGVHGFAGRCMTTLPPRRGHTNERESETLSGSGLLHRAPEPATLRFPGIWSGKGVSNSRPQPWQGY